MGLYLAVDSGGTKADYLLADDTRVLARTRSVTIKRMRTDERSARAALIGALRALAAEAGVPLQQVTRTCIGTAGERVPLVADWLRASFAEHVGGELELVGDVEIALDAAFQGQPGVLVLAGTGSNVAARTAAGEIATFGGWGPFLADQGSGHRIGHQALRAVYLALDRGQATVLLGKILAEFGLATVDELVAYANQLPSPDVSRLAPLVLQAAAGGDEVAARVLREQGEELGELASLGLHRVEGACPDGRPCMAFAGSVMERIAPVREALEAYVRREFPEIAVLPGVVDPLEGALWRARGGDSRG